MEAGGGASGGAGGAAEGAGVLPSSERVDLGRLRAAARTLPERPPSPDAAHAFRPEAEAAALAAAPAPPAWGHLSSEGGQAPKLASGARAARAGAGRSADAGGGGGRGGARVEALVEMALEGVGVGEEAGAGGAAGAGASAGGGAGGPGPEASGERVDGVPSATERAEGALRELRKHCRGRDGCEDVVGAGGFRVACRGATSPDKNVQVQALGLISAIKQHLRGESEESWVVRLEEEWLQSIQEEPAPVASGV